MCRALGVRWSHAAIVVPVCPLSSSPGTRPNVANVPSFRGLPVSLWLAGRRVLAASTALSIEVAMVPSEQANGFGVYVVRAGDEVTVELSGEVDLASAGSLHGFLDSVVDEGPGKMVLDLAALRFIDASGLDVFAAVERRMPPRSLTLRAPSAFTERILTITGFAELIRNAPVEALARLGPEQHSGDSSATVASAPRGSASGLQQAAVMPANDAVVDAALRLVVALAAAMVSGADGVSVTLKRRGRFTTVASSDETIAQMDNDQYATGEGPCLAAAAEGRWFHVDALEREDRWPEFVPRALAGGVNSILSTPLMVEASPVGALNIYSHHEGAFGESAQDLAAIFATEASTIVADVALDGTADSAAMRLHDALDSRETISRAHGVLMERGGLDGDEAAAVLWHSARDLGIPMRQAATEVLTSTRPADPAHEEQS